MSLRVGTLKNYWLPIHLKRRQCKLFDFGTVSFIIFLQFESVLRTNGDYSSFTKQLMSLGFQFNSQVDVSAQLIRCIYSFSPAFNHLVPTIKSNLAFDRNGYSLHATSASVVIAILSEVTRNKQERQASNHSRENETSLELVSAGAMSRSQPEMTGGRNQSNSDVTGLSMRILIGSQYRKLKYRCTTTLTGFSF